MSDALKENILQDYVNKLCKHSRIASDAVKIYLSDADKPERSKEELSIAKYAEVLLEFVYFYLHFTDRFAFIQMEEDIRDALMTELEEGCINSAIDFGFFGLPENPKEEIRKASFDSFGFRQAEYSRYKKTFAEKDEGYKDTLFWEFSKNIEGLVGREHDIGLKMMCIRISVEAIGDLDPKSFIEMVKGD